MTLDRLAMDIKLISSDISIHVWIYPSEYVRLRHTIDTSINNTCRLYVTEVVFYEVDSQLVLKSTWWLQAKLNPDPNPSLNLHLPLSMPLWNKSIWE